MKIGILTFHAAHNYGAVLQCYALQEYLKQEGHDVSVIDYRNNKLLSVYDYFRTDRFLSKNPFKFICLLFKELWLLKNRKSRFESFTEFINNSYNLAFSDSIQSSPYDLIIIGSDQVWNYNLTYGFDKYYWGTFDLPSHTKLASYAASMQDEWPAEMNSLIQSFLSRFDYLSVRETSIQHKLSYILPDKKIEQVVDPTLLISSKQWDKLAKAPQINKPYLFLYQVEESVKAVEMAKQIAEQRNLEIIYLSAKVEGQNSKESVTASPEEFVGFFKYADFVVCSSFHGTVFSLQYHKPFISVKMNTGKDSRVMGLLSSLGLEYHFQDKYERIPDEYTIDQEILDTIICNSINYLKKITTPSI